MTFLGYLLGLLIGGLIVGALARLALPGKDPMSIPVTIAIGIAGSFVAGHDPRARSARATSGACCCRSVCATGIVYLVRRSRGGGLTTPARRPLDR